MNDNERSSAPPEGPWSMGPTKQMPQNVGGVSRIPGQCLLIQTDRFVTIQEEALHDLVARHPGSNTVMVVAGDQRWSLKRRTSLGIRDGDLVREVLPDARLYIVELSEPA